MGAAGLNAITYSGSAASGNFGQSRTISLRSGFDDHPELHAHDRLHAAGVRASGDRVPPARSRRSAAAAGAPGSYDQMITPANAAWAQQLQIWVTPWGFLRGAAASTNATLRTKKIDERRVQGR